LQHSTAAHYIEAANSNGTRKYKKIRKRVDTPEPRCTQKIVDPSVSVVRRLPVVALLPLPCHLLVAVCCSVLQCVAVCCHVLVCVAERFRVLQSIQSVAGRCSVLQCVALLPLLRHKLVAMFCKVLQRVAVCCNVLQCVLQSVT